MPGSSLRRGRMIVACRSLTGVRTRFRRSPCRRSRHSAVAAAAIQEHEGDLALVELRRGQRERPGVPSGAKIACSRNPQKNRLWLAQ